MGRLWGLGQRLQWRWISAAFRRSAPKPIPRPDGYRVFTRAHDREIALSELEAFAGVLSGPDRSAFEANKEAARLGLSEWQAQANAKALIWRTKLALLVDAAPRRCAVTVLIDLSGSMRGQKIMMLIGVLPVFAVVPAALGVQFEILGFTTVNWRGGRSRQDWLAAGKPPWPGRLNDLLHLVIADAGERESARLMHLEPLLRPDVLKENIDGEALEWACSRMMARKAQQRGLIVVSDGAPVDDSTLSANEADILDRHLRDVVADINERGDIRVVGVGVDFSPARYYPGACVAATPDELLDALFCALSDCLTPHPLGIVDLEQTG